VMSCGSGLYVNTLPLQNGTITESSQRTTCIKSVENVGLNLSTSSYMDSPIISPVSATAMNDMAQDHRMQVWGLLFHRIIIIIFLIYYFHWTYSLSGWRQR
jgi:hypothetical protein